MRTQWIKNRLTELSQTPEWLAQRCGVSPFTMKHRFLAGVVPRKPVLMLMAEALQCSIQDLLHAEQLETVEEGEQPRRTALAQ
jgi:hypothetical protein